VVDPTDGEENLALTSPVLDLRLQEALQSRSLALFLGADLAEAITGLPSRADLARRLAERRGLDPSLSLAQVTQRLAKGGYRFDFTSLLREALDTTGKKPQPYHRSVVEFVRSNGVETIVTTTYDGLLVAAFREAGVELNSVVEDGDMAFARRGVPTLIRLYGAIDRPTSLVATEDDHYALWRDRNRENMLDEVRMALRRNTVLFLGYNLADPDFNLLWREVLDRMGRFAVGAFAIWPGLPEDEVQVWRDRQITMLEAGAVGLLIGPDEVVSPTRGDEAGTREVGGWSVEGGGTVVERGSADVGAQSAQSKLMAERKATKLQELETYKLNLARLDREAANYGGRPFAPLIVQNQIQESERAIARIEAESEEIEEDLRQMDQARVSPTTPTAPSTSFRSIP